MILCCVFINFIMKLDRINNRLIKNCTKWLANFGIEALITSISCEGHYKYKTVSCRSLIK